MVTRGHVKKKSTEIEQWQNGPFTMTVLSHCLVHVHISHIKLVGNSHASSLLAQFSTLSFFMFLETKTKFKNLCIHSVQEIQWETMVVLSSIPQL
jgi:hypothetical protein